LQTKRAKKFCYWGIKDRRGQNILTEERLVLAFAPCASHERQYFNFLQGPQGQGYMPLICILLELVVLNPSFDCLIVFIVDGIFLSI
jgi:hypothetical protein